MNRVVSIVVAVALGACGGDDSGPPAGTPITGCDGATLLASAPDRSTRGIWPVGARTVTVGGLTTEVWYPALPGSDAGATPARYDIRLELPPTEAAKIPDADNPWQSCDCARDLPIDDAHGPFPVIVFVHGTAAFRHQSLAIVTHWASRGYIVVAADHPGLKLGDLLAQACGGSAPSQNIDANVDTLLGALAAPAGDLAFLAGHIDATRVAITGHSAGANAAAAASGKPGVRAVVSMAGSRSTTATPSLAASLFLAGTSDSIVSVGQARTAWTSSATPRTFVALRDAGHLAFSDLCETRNAAGKTLLEIAQQYGVCGANLAGVLFDCDPSYLDGPSGWRVIDDATTAVLDETLQCQPHIDLSSLPTTYPQVAEYQTAN